MKYLLSILFIIAAFFYGRTTAPVAPMQLGGTSAKQALVDDYVEAKARLKEGAAASSYLSTTEITTALNDLETKYNVTANDLTTAGGNVLTALDTKMGSQSILCNNPYATALTHSKNANLAQP